MAGIRWSSAIALGLGALQAAAAPTSCTTTNDCVSPLAACQASMNGALPSPTPSGFAFSGNVRKYYIAAEEVVWDYAPTGWDNWLGVCRWPSTLR